MKRVQGNNILAPGVGAACGKMRIFATLFKRGNTAMTDTTSFYEAPRAEVLSIGLSQTVLDGSPQIGDGFDNPDWGDDDY